MKADVSMAPLSHTKLCTDTEHSAAQPSHSSVQEQSSSIGPQGTLQCKGMPTGVLEPVCPATCSDSSLLATAEEVSPLHTPVALAVPAGGEDWATDPSTRHLGEISSEEP